MELPTLKEVNTSITGMYQDTKKLTLIDIRNIMDIYRIYNTYANKLREDYINYGSPIFYGSKNSKKKRKKKKKK